MGGVDVSDVDATDGGEQKNLNGFVMAFVVHCQWQNLGEHASNLRCTVLVDLKSKACSGVAP